MQNVKLLWGITVFSGAMAVAAVLGMVHMRSELTASDERVDRLERDLKAIGGAKARGLVQDVEKLETQVRDVQCSLLVTQDTAREAEKRAAAVEEATQKSIETLSRKVTSNRDGGSDSPGVDAAMLEEVVSKKVEEKVGQRNVGEDGKRKPPLAELSRELGLSPAQEDAVADVLNVGKKRVSEILSIPRTDGTCVLDEFVEALKDPATAQQKMGAIFARLFTEPIPGRTEPYIQEIVRIQTDIKRGMQANMGADQFKQYERSNIDPLDIQTGYDPFAEYLIGHSR